MHAKTETNAQILSLLYPATPNRGVFKFFFKKYENTPQLQIEGYLKFSKKKISSLFRVPRNSKWRGTRKSEKVGYFCNFFKKYGSFGIFGKN